LREDQLDGVSINPEARGLLQPAHFTDRDPFDDLLQLDDPRPLDGKLLPAHDGHLHLSDPPADLVLEAGLQAREQRAAGR